MVSKRIYNTITDTMSEYFRKGAYSKENQKLSINIVNEDLLLEADYSGSVSGAKEEYLRTGEVIAPCLSYAKK